MSVIKTSVIIPTFQREEPLCRMLRSLLATDLESAEILLVDQTPNHKAETLDYLNHISRQVTRIPKTPPSLMAAYNAGAARARGNVLVFLDDDIEVGCADFLNRHCQALQLPGIGGVVGRIRNPDRLEPRPPPINPMAPLGFLNLYFDHNTPMDYPSMAGANMSVRKGLWEKLGGFDEQYTGEAMCGEIDFSFRIRKAGWSIRFEPTAQVFHYYHTPGGCGNVDFLGHSHESHAYYRSFFRNNVYFAIKHFHGALRLRVFLHLYRNHVLNRAYLREGPVFLWRRHMALLHGASIARALFRSR